jgi:Na+/phosphate symporter
VLAIAFVSSTTIGLVLALASVEQCRRERHWRLQLGANVGTNLQHLHRLRSGAASSLDVSAIHIEMINALSRVISHTCSIARAVLGEL